MKFTLSWLKDHLDTEATLDTLTEALTDLGLEVEGVEDPAPKPKPRTRRKRASVPSWDEIMFGSPRGDAEE